MPLALFHYIIFYKAIISLLICMLHQYFTVHEPYYWRVIWWLQTMTKHDRANYTSRSEPHIHRLLVVGQIDVVSPSHSLFSTSFCSVPIKAWHLEMQRYSWKTMFGLWYLISTSRTFGASCPPGCPVSPWLPLLRFSEMAHMYFLECLLDLCLWDHLWGQK